MKDAFGTELTKENLERYINSPNISKYDTRTDPRVYPPSFAMEQIKQEDCDEQT